MPQTDFPALPPPTTVPRQRTKVPIGHIIWMCSLSVAWFIGRQPQLQFLLLLALTKCWKYRIAKMAQYTASDLNSLLPTAPGTHRKRLHSAKPMTRSISAKKQKTRSCLLNSKRWPHHQYSLFSNQHGVLCLLSSGWKLRGSHSHGPSNFQHSSQQTGMERFNNKSAYAFLFPALVYS